ncbi:MAG TPA: selenocysteine-specific translation elongation factor, partial [Gemmatimonadales bacterium]|nr:selenocysteine-specific translation elongation factor [Gemmatimonadales bacterium]
MIIGTAGHIDHGKSTLVAALTGRPMDRLAEERRREITIDLNFAPLELGHGRTAGVVDVPGHEGFVRTMVAGASGIDLVLFAVAADEGIMPQTREHLSILEQLRVPVGIPVITKADLADADWLELVTTELADTLARSSVDFQSPVAVSVKSGVGLDTLKNRLRDYAAALPVKPVADAFRMPIDRVFSLAGVGTVVTGTSWSGRISMGDQVLILPSGLRGRVRSLESYGMSLERTAHRARTAVGIGGIDRSAVRRGDVLVTEELAWSAAWVLDVAITLEASAPKALSSRARVRLHLGTAEVMARVLPRATIQPGSTGMARLKLDRPVVARAEDRFVLRSYSPITTIGGGRVLDPDPPKRRTVWPASFASEVPAERFDAALLRHTDGVTTAKLPLVLGLPRSAALQVARASLTARVLEDLW